MIDTLARHMAALSEARRLTAMVLANNGAFTARQRAIANSDAAQIEALEAALTADHIYQAYRHLEAALAEIQPPGHPSGPPQPANLALGDRISLIGASAPVSLTQAAQIPDAAPPPGGAVSLAERLSRVLELTAMAEVPAAQPQAASVLYASQRDEARVSIVHCTGRMANAMPPGGMTGSHPEFVRLFR